MRKLQNINSIQKCLQFISTNQPKQRPILHKQPTSKPAYHPHSFWHIFWVVFVTFFLIFVLAHSATVFLEHLLARVLVFFVRAGICSDRLSGKLAWHFFVKSTFWYSFWCSFWHSFWHLLYFFGIFPAMCFWSILSTFSGSILCPSFSDKSSGITFGLFCGPCFAFLSCIFSENTALVIQGLKSGAENWPHGITVEVRRAKLTSERLHSRGWELARHTDVAGSQVIREAS